MNKNQFVQSCVDPEDPTRVIYIQWLDGILKGRSPIPDLWRLRALAAGMRTDLDTLIVLAVEQWFHYSITDLRTQGETIIIPVKQPISPATRRKIEGFVALLMEEDDDEA
jgi:hypothetical protein